MSGFDQERAPLVDRRQRAREAFWDESQGTMTGAADGIEAAIETATRVQITPEVLAAYRDTFDTTTAKLRAAFRAAGFEVEA